MAEHTCTLNWDTPNDRVITTWEPPKGIFQVGDTIHFLTPANKIVINFEHGSPFEADTVAKKYDVEKGTPRSLQLRRACFAFSCRNGNLTLANQDLPTEIDQPGTSEYTITLRVQDGAIAAEWVPNKQLLRLGDRIHFVSPDADVSLNFQMGSPFEDETGPKEYIVQKDSTLTKKMQRSCFVFDCWLGGIPSPGTGDAVPTGN